MQTCISCNLTSHDVTFKEKLKCTHCCKTPKRESKDSYLIRMYGITQNRYNEILKEQAGVCAGCGDSPVVFHVDHDHVTKRVRGLLCFGCNIAIGHAKDRPGVLEQLASYLRTPAISKMAL